MNVLIKGIDVKEIKRGAFACLNIDDVVFFVNSDKIIPVPDHGDLIDRDALRQEMRLSDSCNRCERDAYRCQYYDELTVMDVCGRIDDMPVVIPAERSEE